MSSSPACHRHSPNVATSRQSLWPATLALGLGSFVVFANLYVTQPMLPYLVQHFGISSLLAGQTFTITTATLALSLLFFGPLSDAVGRRWLMLSTAALAIVCTLALSWAESLSSMLTWRALQGICLAGLPAIALAYMREELDPTAFRVAVGVYISANSLGGIGGRLLGGFFIDHFSLHESFTLMATVSVILLLPVVYFLPASEHFKRQPFRPKQVLGDIASHLRNRQLRLAYLVGGLNFFIFVNQFSYATFRLSEEPYSLPPSALGMLFLTYLSGTVAAAFSGRLFRHMSPSQVMVLGVVLLMLGSLITLCQSLAWIVAGFLVNALGFFIAHTHASAWVSRQAERAPATASSVYLVCYYLGASSGGYYLDPFWRWAGWTGVVIASLLILLVSLYLTVRLGSRNTGSVT